MTLPDAELPDWARNTVRLAAPLRAADFRIPAPVDAGTIDAHVIGVVENQATTCRTVRTIAVREGAAEPAGGADLARLAVVERHHGSGRIGLGLVSGFGLRGGCGLASTVAHDSHNLLILGTDPAAMAIAGNRVAELGGGIALVRGETVLVDLSLPLAGLMSDRPAEEVACRADALHEALQECGCPLHNAFMTFSLLALPVIPALRLTDLGLVDVAAQAIVPLWVDG